MTLSARSPAEMDHRRDRLPPRPHSPGRRSITSWSRDQSCQNTSSGFAANMLESEDEDRFKTVADF